jgi:hypothetical protein
MYTNNRRGGIADLLFRTYLDMSQVGWLTEGQLNWLSSIPTASLTLHLGYDDFDDWQSVSIDAAPGTAGLVTDPNEGLIVSGGLAIVWKGWLGRFS